MAGEDIYLSRGNPEELEDSYRQQADGLLDISFFNFDISLKCSQRMMSSDALNQPYTTAFVRQISNIKKASELIESIIGHQAYTNLSNTIKSTNRLYQASMNIANSIQAAIGNLRSISEVIFGNTGKIGNALLRAGVVFEDAYAPMPESPLSGKMNVVTLINQELQNLDDAANVVQSVVSDTKSIVDTVAELKNQKQEFDTAKRSAETAVSKKSLVLWA